MMATRVRSMLQAAIYEKSLRLRESAANVPPVTLMQVDSGKVEELTYSLHTLWDGIFQVVGYSVLLWWYLGIAGFAGIVVLLIGLPFNASLQRDLSSLNKKCLQASDARLAKECWKCRTQGNAVGIWSMWERFMKPRVPFFVAD